MSLKDKIGRLMHYHPLVIVIFGLIANFVLVGLFLWWVGHLIIQALLSH
jgi:hypothetical protein